MKTQQFDIGSDAYIHKQLIAWLAGPAHFAKSLSAFIFPDHPVSPVFNICAHCKRDISVKQFLLSTVTCQNSVQQAELQTIMVFLHEARP